MRVLLLTLPCSGQSRIAADMQIGLGVVADLAASGGRLAVELPAQLGVHLDASLGPTDDIKTSQFNRLNTGTGTTT